MILVIVVSFALAAFGFTWLTMLQRKLEEIERHLCQISSDLRELCKTQDKAPEKVRDIGDQVSGL